MSDSVFGKLKLSWSSGQDSADPAYRMRCMAANYTASLGLKKYREVVMCDDYIRSQGILLQSLPVLTHADDKAFAEKVREQLAALKEDREAYLEKNMTEEIKQLSLEEK